MFAAQRAVVDLHDAVVDDGDAQLVRRAEKWRVRQKAGSRRRAGEGAGRVGPAGRVAGREEGREAGVGVLFSFPCGTQARGQDAHGSWTGPSQARDQDARGS